MPDRLTQTLDGLGYSDSDGLVTALTPSSTGARDYYWRDLRGKIGLDAAFFHDGVPLVGFSTESTERGLTTLRRRLWNYGRVPLLVNTTDDVVSAFSASSAASKGPLGQSDAIQSSRLADIASSASRLD